MKRNNMADMHKQFFILVKMLRKDGHDPLAIAGCMLAGAVQIYQSELGEDTAFQLLDQIANGGDDQLGRVGEDSGLFLSYCAFCSIQGST